MNCMPNRLVLLAHPDDEMLCLPFLMDSRQASSGTDFYLYLCLNSAPSLRREEAKKAIAFLGLSLRRSELVNHALPIRDGKGWLDFKSNDLHTLFNLLDSLQLGSILSFAYEGGHQDHDLAHVISRRISSQLDIPFIEFSGYRKHPHLPFFIVSQPRSKLKKVNFSRFTAISLFFNLAGIHRTQTRVWFMLGVPILIRLISGVAFSADSNPHSLRLAKGAYLYELRRKASRDAVENEILRFVDSGNGER